MGSKRQIKDMSMVEAEEEEEAFMYSRNLASATVLPMALRTVLELDLLEMIAKAGPGACVSPSELAAQLPTKNVNAPDMLDRILRILASYSILNCTLRDLPTGGVERLYSLAPLCKFLIKDVDGDSMAPFLLSTQHKVNIDSWYYMKDAILEGGSTAFAKAHGMNPHEYIGQNPILNETFSRATSGFTTIVTKKILQTYTGFEGLSLIVDVGGNTGSTLNMIITKYPNIKGVNFDLPHVVKDAPSYPGVQHVGGDMFVSVPKGDAIILKHVCHNWNDKDCIKILKNCNEALSDNGKMIIVDYILPVVPDTKLLTRNVLYTDLNMLSLSNGGKERTENEFEALAKGAGFVGFQVACCTANTWVMECFKKP